MTTDTHALYEAADAILHACTHAPRTNEVSLPTGELRTTCCACWNAHVYARRAARKAQLAERENDCARCGAKPHTYTYGGYRLCGRCLTATKREHAHASNAAGVLSIFTTHLLVNTSAWKGTTP